MKKLSLLRISRGLVVIGLLLIPCSACAYISTAFLFAEGLTCLEAATLPQFMLEGDALFKFPASAQAMQMTTESTRYWCVISVVFKISPSDLDAFLATTRVSSLAANAPLEWANDYSQDMMKLDVNPRAMKSYLFGRQELRFLSYQMILVDTSNPDTYTVFLVTDQGELD